MQCGFGCPLVVDQCLDIELLLRVVVREHVTFGMGSNVSGVADIRRSSSRRAKQPRGRPPGEANLWKRPT